MSETSSEARYFPQYAIFLFSQDGVKTIGVDSLDPLTVNTTLSVEDIYSSGLIMTSEGHILKNRYGRIGKIIAPDDLKL